MTFWAKRERITLFYFSAQKVAKKNHVLGNLGSHADSDTSGTWNSGSPSRLSLVPLHVGSYMDNVAYWYISLHGQKKKKKKKKMRVPSEEKLNLKNCFVNISQI